MLTIRQKWNLTESEKNTKDILILVYKKCFHVKTDGKLEFCT